MLILCIALLNIMYLIGFFSILIWLNVTETEYFLGYSPRPIKFQIRNAKFNIGFFIPVIGPIYTLVDGEKRMKYPWEFTQHSLGKRLITTLAGAVSLLIAGLVIAIINFYFSTESYISKEEVNRHGIYPSDWAREAGFLPGDQIIAINGKDYQKFEDLITPQIVVAPETHYTVLRQGEKVEVTVRDIAQHINQKGQSYITLRAPFEVSAVGPGSPAEQAGIQPGDRITKVNEQPVINFTEMAEALRADDDGLVALLIERKENDHLKTFTEDVVLDGERRIGIFPKELISPTVKGHSFGESLYKGPAVAFRGLFANVRGLVRVVTGNFSSKKTLSAPIAIHSIYDNTFWVITGFFALQFALWNLLPLPKSAFWELIPLAYEGLTKKKYSYTAFRKSTTFSWFLLGGFYVWTFVNDIMSLF